jgi:uncharacterized OB-fold protein
MKMIPNISDRDTDGFFQAAAENRLVYRGCENCRHAIHPPTVHCPHCGSADTVWRDAAGSGTLYAWTTVTHQVHPDYPVPYTVVVVQLDDAKEVRLVGRIDGEPALQFGMPMQVCFETLAPDVVLPQWRLA